MVANGKLYTQVMEKLRFCPMLDASNIALAIKGNHDVVVLEGTVKSFFEKVVAVNEVKDIQGVKAVVDEVKVESSLKYKRSDTEIATTATKVLEGNTIIPANKIKVVVKDGYITLTGEVEWWFQKKEAEKVLKRLWGVKSIMNFIVVKPNITIDEGTIKNEILNEFERHARIDASKVKIKVEGNKVILQGEVSNFDEIDIAENTAWSIPGVREVYNELIIGSNNNVL